MTLPIKGTMFTILDTTFIGATDDGIAFEGVLVPVVPCEHGNYARHIVRQNFSTSKYEWCSGAAVGEETP